MRPQTWAELIALSPEEQNAFWLRVFDSWDQEYESRLSAEGFLDTQEEANAQGLSVGELLK